MKTRLTWLLILMLALSAFWGCSDDDDDPVVPTETAFEALAAAGAAYVNDSADCPGVMSAADLEANLNLYTVIDIRSADAYEAGHIPGAYHSSLGTLLADLPNMPQDKPFVIACYSGQSAGHAKIAMEMLGYEDTKSLLFGMSSWHTSLDSWTSKCANTLGTVETTNNNGDLTVHDFPVLSEDVDSVVAERVAAMLTAGFKAKSYADIEDYLNDYFVINYFGEADYEGTGSSGVPGHIPGAFQFTPYASMGIEEMLPNIPNDMPVIVYCWTGQHSSQITAYLNMLGYEAYSLKNGSNNLFYDDLTAHKWSSAAQNDFALETGSGTTPEFEAIQMALIDYVNDSADCPGVMSAVDLNDNLELYTVIDIRAESAYLAGHIPGAYHSGLSTLMDDVGTTIPTDKPFVVACYTGQSAGHVKVALEMMGYEDTKSLLFGMSSWHTTLDSWTGNCANNLGQAETTNNNAMLEDHSYPSMTGEDLDSRIEAMLTGGFKGKNYTDIEDYLDDYFVLNYFGEADYEGTGGSGVPGHIPGAFQFTPYASMDVDEMLGNIPTDMPVVVYCWTGQHSSQITAYLNMLGYEAYSLKFGSNNLFHDDLTAHKWTSAAQNDFDLEMGYMAGDDFNTIADALIDYVNDSADCPGVMSAVDLNDNLNLYTVIDIRAESAYDAGHIPGAYHSSLSTLEADLVSDIPTDKPFVIACYTGQSAGHAKVAMEMMGYEDTKSLLFGMSSWSIDLDSWTGNCNNNLGTAETTNNNGDLTWHMYPDLTGEDVDGRVTAMLDAGFKGKNYTDIEDYLESYFVVNYFGEADYEGTGGSGVPGHIPGAFQFTPYASMGVDEMLGNLPNDMPIVVYCWTGQHSSQITAYLNMLGYEAYSLKFGSNNLFHDDLTAHKWSAAQQNDFALEVTPALAMN